MDRFYIGNLPLRHLVLIGGGHTHALVLKKLAERPIAGVAITLISDVEQAPYSGMLPGHVAGLYSHEEMHIDLPRLCERAGGRFIHAAVDGLDLAHRQALQHGAPIGPVADALSVNVGSTPNLHGVPGVEEWAVPSKPVPRLLAGWESLKAAVKGSAHPQRVLIVGGGAGGVELVLAMHSQTQDRADYTLIHSGPHLLSGHNGRVRRRLAGVLMERGITVRLEQRVAEVKADGVHLQNGEWLPADFVIWVTQPTPPAWLRGSGLALTDEGFIRVKPTLQTLRHPWVVAAGDVATIESRPTPKSGVFAVRMAGPLEANLRAFFSDGPFRSYQPQKHFLSLIGTADRRAVASRRWLALHSRLMWKWKDRIDRRFMAQFVH